ncbi:unnamed protein product [Gongylonema pulchrum]|uniref:7TM_GPCR_Srx domain-containing protein n=1 Tax=Gongylonema pulchrum TaxID=637853 RepID=A0A183EFS1_9BILA|nr:unnamed protein product [Gongylonema pulchrum]
MDIHHVTIPLMLNDLTMITLNWRSFEYLSLEQNRVYTVTSFIAEIGGSIGVWLGLSVLSLIQTPVNLTFMIDDTYRVLKSYKCRTVYYFQIYHNSKMQLQSYNFITAISVPAGVAFLPATNETFRISSALSKPETFSLNSNV